MSGFVVYYDWMWNADRTAAYMINVADGRVLFTVTKHGEVVNDEGQTKILWNVGDKLVAGFTHVKQRVFEIMMAKNPRYSYVGK